jgi:hypothetical protein
MSINYATAPKTYVVARANFISTLKNNWKAGTLRQNAASLYATLQFQWKDDEVVQNWLAEHEEIRAAFFGLADPQPQQRRQYVPKPEKYQPKPGKVNPVRFQSKDGITHDWKHAALWSVKRVLEDKEAKMSNRKAISSLTSFARLYTEFTGEILLSRDNVTPLDVAITKVLDRPGIERTHINAWAQRLEEIAHQTIPGFVCACGYAHNVTREERERLNNVPEEPKDLWDHAPSVTPPDEDTSDHYDKWLEIHHPEDVVPHAIEPGESEPVDAPAEQDILKGIEIYDYLVEETYKLIERETDGNGLTRRTIIKHVTKWLQVPTTHKDVWTAVEVFPLNTVEALDNYIRIMVHNDWPHLLVTL